MQDPDPKCRHFVISWHFMAFWHVCQKANCITKSAFSAFPRLFPPFRLFHRIGLFDFSALIEIHWLLPKIALMEQVESSCDIKWTDCGAYCTMYSLERHTHVLECFVLAVARIIKINSTIPSWIEDALSDKVLYNAQDRSATQERSKMYKWLNCAILPSFVGVHES